MLTYYIKMKATEKDMKRLKLLADLKKLDEEQ
jgi:hypothetical protein